METKSFDTAIIVQGPKKLSSFSSYTISTWVGSRYALSWIQICPELDQDMLLNKSQSWNEESLDMLTSAVHKSKSL